MAEADSQGLTPTRQHQAASNMESKGPGIFPILQLPAEVRLQHPIRNERPGPHSPYYCVCKRIVAAGGMASEEPVSSTPKQEALLMMRRRCCPRTAPGPPFLRIASGEPADLHRGARPGAQGERIRLRPPEPDDDPVGSGFWATRDSTQRLLPQPWKRDALRCACFEVTTWDLVLPGGDAVAVSVGLCRL